MAQTFVVLDLETTGLDYENDEIIEIAAVKIKRGLIVDEFSSLVKAKRSIGTDVQLLTGINDAMLQDQPSIEQLIPAVSDFIGDSIPVAHNADFDRSFLTRYWPDQRLWIDTVVMSQIVYPCQPSHSLGWLTRALEIPHDQAHRAMSDAMATAQLFMGMIRELEAFSPVVKEDLLHLAEKDESPMADIIRKCCSVVSSAAVKAGESTPAFAEKNRDDRQINDEFFLDEDILESYLGASVSADKQIEGFEERPQQLELSRQVAAAFNDRACLLAEAGTGTGKSLAYLLPAALYSLGSGKQVAVSTHTRNLQEQLLNKDIPLLNSLLDEPVTATVLKGRGNYLCKRLYKYFSSDPSSDELRYFLMRIAVWLGNSKSGDGSELSLTSYGRRNWQRICACKENCAPFCPYRRQNGCYVQKARVKASKADILILNHSLLIANASQETGFLPSLPYLVIDEAHHLEDVTEEQLTTKIDFFDILNLLSRYKRREKAVDTGVLPSIAKISGSLYEHIDTGRIDEYVEKLTADVENTVAAAEKFYEVLDGFFSCGKQKNVFLPIRIRITAQHRADDDWSVVTRMGEELALSLTRLSANSFSLLDDYRSWIDDEDNILPKGIDELFTLASIGRELADTIRVCICSEDDNYVAWAEYSDLEKRPSVSIAPIDISELLSDLLYVRTEALVMTSATLSVGGDFSYFKHRVGLDILPEPPREIALPSPFMYKEQALFAAVNDLPDWSRCTETEACAAISDALKNILSASRGRALVLFTSHNQLRNVYREIKEPLAEEGITVLAHGVSGHPSMLLDRLKKEDNCCILGAASFWEGVDVIGEALSLIIVVRLPFLPPNTPLAVTRMERIEEEGRSSFNEYSLPMALIRFKQGFGRLIRSHSDSGVFCVLDKRLLEKYYGRSFIKVLPEMRTFAGSTQAVAAAVKKWLDR